VREKERKRENRTKRARASAAARTPIKLSDASVREWDTHALAEKERERVREREKREREQNMTRPLSGLDLTLINTTHLTIDLPIPHIPHPNTLCQPNTNPKNFLHTDCIFNTLARWLYWRKRNETTVECITHNCQ